MIPWKCFTFQPRYMPPYISSISSAAAAGNYGHRAAVARIS
jgi:hypothetical protein